ncbi:MAG TPA: mandelate racemase/muconate lactonizing enzyme family protein [Roseiflexaceae bacterium]|nr:mandelate racemase/muconate lactonizing enzyme family protein [Roseiflexaceae bacterium]
MQITDVRCFLCSSSNPAGYVAGSAIIRIETDIGVAGHGEALMGLFCGEVAAAATQYYAPLLIGADPSRIGALWQTMFDSSVWWGRSGAAVSVIGAIESALWDIAGKLAGVPCYQLLSDTPRASVPVYASLGSAPEDPARVPPLVEALVAEGFRGLKLGLQFGNAAGTEIYEPRGDALLALLDTTLAAIRRTVGDSFIIGVDGHMGGIPNPISRTEALAVAQVIERYGGNFFEQPLSYLDPAEDAWLRERTKVRIAGGESLALREGFEIFTMLGALDVLQPDVNYVGGLGQALAIIRLAEAEGLSVLPHSWCGGPGFLSNVHLALSSLTVERLEMGRELTGLQAAALIEPLDIRDGLLYAPTAPGLGFDFDAVLAERFPFPPGLAERASVVMVVPPATQEPAS